MRKTFSQLIYSARQNCNYSQKKLAELVGVDHTYISKVENDRFSTPPSAEVIQSLADCLYLDAMELKRLAGRPSVEDLDLFKELARTYPQFLSFMRRINNDPDFADRVLLYLEEELKCFEKN